MNDKSRQDQIASMKVFRDAVLEAGGQVATEALAVLDDLKIAPPWVMLKNGRWIRSGLVEVYSHSGMWRVRFTSGTGVSPSSIDYPLGSNVTRIDSDGNNRYTYDNEAKVLEYVDRALVRRGYRVRTFCCGRRG